MLIIKLTIYIFDGATSTYIEKIWEIYVLVALYMFQKKWQNLGILQKYYRNITFILNLIIYIDFFIKKDKILKELWLYCRNKKGKKYKYYLSHFAKYNNGAN